MSSNLNSIFRKMAHNVLGNWRFAVA